MDEREALVGFDRASVSMILTDPRADDNPIVYVNAAFERTTGYQRSAVVGRNCRFLQGEGTDKAAVDRIREAVAARRDVTVDILNYRADGEPFTNRLIVAPIADAGGEVIYFLGIQKELRADERTRDALDDLLGKLRARVADDLALLLDGIGASGSGDEPFDYASMMRRLECLQLGYEAMRLSDAARDGAEVDLGALLSRVASAIAADEGRAGIRYAQAIEAMTVTPDAALRVSLLVSEMLSNAFSHAFERMEEGFVELRMARLAAGGLRVTVTDDGVGLPSNAPFPDDGTRGGRLSRALTDGLEATLSPVRGAAGTVLVLDVPAGVVER